MYTLLRRSEERPWALPAHSPENTPGRNEPGPLILHMQENRSFLSHDARICFSVIGALLVATSIGPALQGHWLVPVFSILTLAALTFALERHAQSAPAREILELADGRVRHQDSLGRQIEFPAARLKLAVDSSRSSDLRLFLRSHEGAFEFGRCLSLEERRAVVPLVAAALTQVRGT